MSGRRPKLIKLENKTEIMTPHKYQESSGIDIYSYMPTNQKSRN